MTLLIALTASAIWFYLLVARGRFWRAAERDEREAVSFAPPVEWPRVVAVIPARDEAEVVAGSVGSLLTQNYPGCFTVILVDDQSSDRTAQNARGVAVAAGAADRLTVLTGSPLPSGWTGKLWAVAQGIRHAESLTEPPDYLLLTDADIAYGPDALTRLVARARADGLVLTSLMARLHCESAAERAMIPAFIFFFQICPAAAIAASAHRNSARHGAYLSCTACTHVSRQWPRASSRGRVVGADGICVSTGVPLLPRLAAVGAGDAGDRDGISAIHARLGLSALALAWRHVEGARTGGSDKNWLQRWEHDSRHLSLVTDLPPHNHTINPVSNGCVSSSCHG